MISHLPSLCDGRFLSGAVQIRYKHLISDVVRQHVIQATSFLVIPRVELFFIFLHFVALVFVYLSKCRILAVKSCCERHDEDLTRSPFISVTAVFNLTVKLFTSPSEAR